jgi:negative regulator of sigma-B (phosphoserine phosphatase)
VAAVSPVVAGSHGRLEWAIASRAMPGELECGDAAVVEPRRDGVLVAAVDGLGHGPGAHRAAAVAVSTLRQHVDRDAEALVRLCHDELRSTRGAVMSVATIHLASRRMAWVGVGNVTGLLFRGDPRVTPFREALVQRGGVVGDRLPTLRVAELELALGDTLVMASDGLATAFADRTPEGRDAREIAERLLAQYGRDTDDALALVVAWTGAS